MPANLEGNIKQLQIETYIEHLSSSSATPGGGAASALTGAQAVALLSMVCNLSTSKKFESVRDLMVGILSQCSARTAILLDLAKEDAMQFEKVMHASRLPGISENDKKYRAERLQAALRAAADVPLQVIRTIEPLLGCCEDLINNGNRNLITDVGVALHLFTASLQSARLNVLINLKSINDRTVVDFYRSELKSILGKATPAINKSLQDIELILNDSTI